MTSWMNMWLATAAITAVAIAILVALLFAQWRALRAARAEAQMRQAELAHAGRLAVVGEISASIAHEIAQPLGAILGNADAAELLLARERVPVRELRRILADIRADQLRAHEVIHRLRTLLERNEVERRAMDLHAALSDVLRLVGPEARRRGVELIYQPRAMKSTVLGDAVQLQQVMLNLLINAMDAVDAMAGASRQVLVATFDCQGFIEARVSDRGTGFGGHDTEALFSSFFTTKDGGLGLGLSIARSIVHAHRGAISAAPRQGGGAVFIVRLPRVPPAPATAAARAAPGRAAQAARRPLHA